MSTLNSGGVRDYLARVRTALADLPPAEVEEILEDVRPHLQDIGTELGDSASIDALIERLGSPESYAAELRAAGGYPAAPTEETVAATEPKRGRGAARLAVWGLAIGMVGLTITGVGVALTLADDSLYALLLLLPILLASAWYVMQHGVRVVEDLPEVSRVREMVGREQDTRGAATARYLRSLQPAWRIVAAAVLLILAVLLLMRSSSAVLALPLFVAAAAALLWAGPKSAADRRLLWVSLPVSAFAIGAMLGLLGQLVEVVDDRGRYDPYVAAGRYSDGSPQLYYGNEAVENIYAFNSEGEPLTGVYLYDARGRPLTLPRYACQEGTGGQRRIGEDNRFPRPRLEFGAYDDEGNYNGYNAYRATCRAITGVPFSAAIPKEVAPAAPPTK